MGLGVVAVFSVLLVAIPLSSFFAILHGRFDEPIATLLGQSPLNDTSRLVFAGLAGVVSVNLIVAAFLIAAWSESVPPQEERAKEE